MPYRFLSDDWFDAVEALRPELDALRPRYEAEVPAELLDATVNLVVTGGPDGTRELHIAGGTPDRGLADGASVSVEVPYDVARSLFVAGRPDGLLQAFLAGTLVVRGDLTKLLALQPLVPEAGELPGDVGALYERVKALTA